MHYEPRPPTAALPITSLTANVSQTDCGTGSRCSNDSIVADVEQHMAQCQRQLEDDITAITTRWEWLTLMHPSRPFLFTGLMKYRVLWAAAGIVKWVEVSWDMVVKSLPVGVVPEQGYRRPCIMPVMYLMINNELSQTSLEHYSEFQYLNNYNKRSSMVHTLASFRVKGILWLRTVGRMRERSDTAWQ